MRFLTIEHQRERWREWKLDPDHWRIQSPAGEWLTGRQFDRIHRGYLFEGIGGRMIRESSTAFMQNVYRHITSNSRATKNPRFTEHPQRPPG